MPRIVWNDNPARGSNPLPVEVHYGSPHEFVSSFADALASGTLTVPGEGAPPAGTRRELLVEVGFIGRTLRLKVKIEKIPAAAGVLLRLMDLDRRMREELVTLVQQIQNGLAFEAARAADPSSGEHLSPERQIRGMPTTLKIMLALKADKRDRAALATDPDPQVIQFLLRNSRLSLDEVRSFAARPGMSQQHLMTIASHPGWSSDELVKLNLARNPRLPEILVESLLGSMSVPQLKIVAGSMSTSPKARRVAHRILYDKGA